MKFDHNSFRVMLCISRQHSTDFGKKKPNAQTIKGRIREHKDSLTLAYSLPELAASNCWLTAAFYNLENPLHLGSAHHFNTT